MKKYFIGSKNKNLDQVKDDNFLNQHWRGIAIFFLLFFLIGMCFYAAWEGPRQEVLVWKMFNNIEQYQGIEVKGSYNKIIGRNDDFWMAQPYGHTINLKIDSEVDLEPNLYISYRGRIENNYIKVSEIHLHKERNWKYLVSLLPLLYIGIWFGKKYRFDRKEFYFKERS